jgi:hypothetical protein
MPPNIQKTNKNQPPKSTKAKERKEKRIKKRKVCGSGAIKEIHMSEKFFKTKRGIKKRVGKINK